MIDKTSGAGLEAMQDSEPLAAADVSAGAFPAQGRGAAAYPQGGQNGHGAPDLGQSLLIQGDQLVEEGMALLARGQKAEGMRVLREGAELQHRASLLCARPGQDNGGFADFDEWSAPQPLGNQRRWGGRGEATLGTLPQQYASLALRSFRSVQPPREYSAPRASPARGTAGDAVPPVVAPSADDRMATDQFPESSASRDSLAKLEAAISGKSRPFIHKVNYERNPALDGQFEEHAFASAKNIRNDVSITAPYNVKRAAKIASRRDSRHVVRVTFDI